MTRTIKYKDLRAVLEAENVRLEKDLTSDDLFTRMRAIYINSLECKGKRAKHEIS